MRKRHLLLSLILLLPPTAAADYRVDLIVTLNRSAAPDIAAQHGTIVEPPSVMIAVDMADRLGLQRAGISLLPREQFGLQEQWQKLRNSNFRPVFRQAWRITPRPTATAVRIHDDFLYRITPVTNGLATVPTSVAYELNRLDGTVLVQQSSGLRVTLNLSYTLPLNAPPAENPSSSTPLAIEAAQLSTLRLHAEKRVNLGQAHFFDHPLLGVLLKVSPAD